MEERDQTPIPYVLQDRLNLQSANENLKAIGQTMDEMKNLMTEHIKVQHAKLDEEVEELRVAELIRKEKRVARYNALKIAGLIVGLVGGLTTLAFAFHIL